MRLSGTFSPDPGREAFDIFIASVRAAEQAGFERAWVFDSQMMWADLYVYLSHALASTDHIIMGAGVTNPVTRHLTVTANAHVTLNKLYPGRIMLAMGRGNTSCRRIGLKPLGLAEYETAVQTVKALIAGESVHMNETEIRITFANDSIPTIIPAFGPKVLRLAGAHADVVHLDIGANPEAVGWAIDLVREGAKAARRDPEEIEIGLWAPLYVADEEEAALALARSYVEDSLRTRCAALQRSSPSIQFPETLTRLVKAEPATVRAAVGSPSSASEKWRQDYLGNDEISRLPIDLVDEHVIAGSAEKCLERIRALHELGVAEICAFILNGEFEQMERIGSEIIPALQSLGS